MMQDTRRLYKISWIQSKAAAVLTAATAIASCVALLCRALSVANAGAIIVASALVGAALSSRALRPTTYSESRDALLLLALSLSITAAYLLLA